MPDPLRESLNLCLEGDRRAATIDPNEWLVGVTVESDADTLEARLLVGRVRNDAAEKI